MSGIIATSRRASGSSESPLLRFVTFSIAGRGGYLLVGFAASILLARLLGPAGRGLLGLMLSVSGLALVLTTFGLPLAAVYFAARRDADHGALLGNSLAETLLLAAVLVPISFWLHGPIAHAFGEGRGGLTWVLVAGLVCLTFLDWMTHAQILGMLLMARFNVMLVLSRVAYLVGVAVLVGVAGMGVAGAVIATGLGAIAMVAGSLGPILARGRPRLNWGLCRRTVHYGLRVQIGSVFQLANGRLDVIILQSFRPLSQVGYYVVAQTVAELGISLANAFSSSLMPLMSSYEGDERSQRASIQSIRHHGLLAALAVLFNAGFGTLVILLAYGPRFQQAVAPMLILLPGIWFLGMGIVIEGDLSGRGRPGLASALAGLSAVVTVALDLALIPPLGMYGAALASVAAYTTYGIASLLALRRVSGIPLRRLMVPTRQDLAVYARLLRHARRMLRPGAGESPASTSGTGSPTADDPTVRD